MSMPISVISSVVPYIGTWIETEQRELPYMTEGVVPYIGTWIETSDNAIKMSGLESYLIQVRGLKLTWKKGSTFALRRTLYRYVD